MFGEQPSIFRDCEKADLIGPTEAERRILDFRRHGLSYAYIEEKLGVKPRAAQTRINAYHRRAGISVPVGRPRQKFGELLGNRDRNI